MGAAVVWLWLGPVMLGLYLLVCGAAGVAFARR
jgi:hypothetical protein